MATLRVCCIRVERLHGNSSENNRTGKVLAQSESNKNDEMWHKKGISLQKDSMNHVMRLVRDDNGTHIIELELHT